ncbi:MAG: hypothetical protein WC947_10280 [Elusimicrobiota bacterium]
MPDKKQKPASTEDLLVTLMYTQDALIKVLIKKGLITEEEVLTEIVNSKQKLKKSNEIHH